MAFSSPYISSEVVLDKICLAFTSRLIQEDEVHIQDLRLQEQDVFNAFRYVITGYVLGKTQKPIHLNPVPISCWQMFKRDYMPTWFIRFFPIVCRFDVIDATVLYPKLDFPLPRSEYSTVILNHRNT